MPHAEVTCTRQPGCKGEKTLLTPECTSATSLLRTLLGVLLGVLLGELLGALPGVLLGLLLGVLLHVLLGAFLVAHLQAAHSLLSLESPFGPCSS